MIMLLLCFFIIMKCEGSEVSNKMHAWGFKREGSGKSPTFDKTANSIIEKYEGISVGNKDESVCGKKQHATNSSIYVGTALSSK